MADDDGFDDGPDHVVVLGGELAAASRVEQDHVPPGPSPIDGVDYPEAAGDLWRWVDCAQDAAMSRFVGSHAAADEPTRAMQRASLTMDDLYTVLLFARRRAFTKPWPASDPP